VPVSSQPLRPGNVLIYDGECFFCSNYVRLLNFRAAIGDLVLVDARDRSAVEALQIRPADLNEGMMLILGEERYFGADALHRLALLSTGHSQLNKLNHFVFQHRALSRILYPFLKTGRRTYLFLSGKDIIR
jgi:predicted DCC family thiol-disulfide oxidoreductase YuxK